MKIKNQTEIQLMKILFKTNGKKATKNVTSQRAYPIGLEKTYYRELKGFFKPLTDYVNKYIDEHLEPLLRGDSEEIHLDAIPGNSFRNMIYNLENWLSIYMPDISDLPKNSNNNIILTTLGKTADEAMEFGEKEFSKMLEKGIHVNLPTTADWWEDMKDSWAEDNYDLITSNAKKYVSQINTLTEQAIVNGLSPAKLKEEIKKATEGLSDKHCKLLARDQMGKLNGQITQAQMEEIGLDLYVWSTAYDDRVRDSHALMEGLLCRWDDASVCSYDNGKTWVARPSGAVDLHPGQDIQCRCVALSFYPELVSEMEGTSLNEQTEGLPDVQDLPQFNKNEIILSDEKIKELDEISNIFNSFKNSNSNYNENTLSNLENELKNIIKSSNNDNISISKEAINEYLTIFGNREINFDKISTGLQWGYATDRNNLAKSLSYIYGKSYYPVERDVMGHVIGLNKTYNGKITDVEDLISIVKNSKLNNKKFDKIYSAMAKPDELPYLFRAETRKIEEIKNWKVGSQFDLVGVNSFTANKEHNKYWLDLMCENSNDLTKCRFNFKRTKKFEDSIVMIRSQDVDSISFDDKFPQDIVSICSKAKIVKIEKKDDFYDIYCEMIE